MAFLFTDAQRLAEPLAAMQRLPAGSGVVLRQYGSPGREALAQTMVHLARRHGLCLLLAGDGAMAQRLGADGLHLPENLLRRALWRPETAAAHGAAAIVAAWRAGAGAVFISPVFATASHPGAPGLGMLRFAVLLRLARRYGLKVYALGGIDSRAQRRLAPLKPDGYGGIGRYLG
ncbi:thiamine phosphate synthase [Ferrovibrio sp.]|uniref:thiamine phosphate synthase n=1 Tax=Ferrovibrio sp. TaxID=1917215 RepID=UPI001B5D4804|nr:thiamine phosphate synthase [Ferrovibrio sp.]MBP7064349.1 thiamine phosphate synthase [Ferrovibrio sp.]